jgi:hypothetical protein
MAMPRNSGQLLGAKKADLVFADRPNNVSIYGHTGGLGTIRHRELREAPSITGAIEATYSHKGSLRPAEPERPSLNATARQLDQTVASTATLSRSSSITSRKRPVSTSKIKPRTGTSFAIQSHGSRRRVSRRRAELRV